MIGILVRAKNMFPITFTPPKYIESWIVDFVDDFAAVYEKYYSLKKEVRAASYFLLILLLYPSLVPNLLFLN